MLWIVGIVVYGAERRELVEALGEHALGVEVGEAQRPNDAVRAVLAAPLLHGVEQGPAYVQVVNEVYPPEPDNPLAPGRIGLMISYSSHAPHVLVPAFVGTMVDDGGHTAHNLSVDARQEECGIAETESWIATGIERIERVLQQVWHSLRTVLVELVVEADKGTQLFPRGNLADRHVSHISFFVC